MKICSKAIVLYVFFYLLSSHAQHQIQSPTQTITPENRYSPLLTTPTPSSAQKFFRFEDGSTLFRFGLGFSLQQRIMQRQAFSNIGIDAIMAKKIGENFAIGSFLSLYLPRQEIGFNIAANTGFFYHKASLAYSFGKQKFSFISGLEQVKVGQRAYGWSTDYAIPQTKNLGLHNIGISLWRAHSRQRQFFKPRITGVTRGNHFELVLDPLILSAGHLSGAAFRGQLALQPNLVAQASLGREKLFFPFSDGSSEKNTRLYFDISFYIEPRPSWLFRTSYISGVSERKLQLSLKRKAWQLIGFYSKGRAQLINNYGTEIAYDFFYRQEKENTFSLAERMRTQETPSSLLYRASARPHYFPLTFLLKEDPTSARTLLSIKKDSMPKNTSINRKGVLKIPIAAAGERLIIKRVFMNQGVTPVPAIQAFKEFLLIDIKNLPEVVQHTVYTVVMTITKRASNEALEHHYVIEFGGN